MKKISPLLMPKTHEITQPVAAVVRPDEPAKLVRPGLVDKVVYETHDGVVKTKHLKPGQTIQPFLHGEPKGSIRTVDTVVPSEDGSEVTLTFLSLHASATYKAAYRWFDESLVGTLVPKTVQVPALVAYEEV